MTAETGYVLRLGRELNTGYVLNSVPYFFQDRVQPEFRAGRRCGGRRSSGGEHGRRAVTRQQWFENLVGAGQTVDAGRFARR